MPTFSDEFIVGMLINKLNELNYNIADILITDVD